MRISEFHRRMKEEGSIPTQKIYGREHPTGKGTLIARRNKGIRRAWKESRKKQAL